LPQVFLYKLHGSLDWVRDQTSQQLSRVPQTELIATDQMEVIFGREFKLEAADPYLFYAYEFRQSALEAKRIVTIGYGFADEHINKMLSQALRAEGPRQLLVVSKCDEAKERDRKRDEVAARLGIAADRISVEPGTAKSFLSSDQLGVRLVESAAEPGEPF
jgi:SIR2-like protein